MTKKCEKVHCTPRSIRRGWTPSGTPFLTQNVWEIGMKLGQKGVKNDPFWGHFGPPFWPPFEHYLSGIWGIGWKWALAGLKVLGIDNYGVVVITRCVKKGAQKWPDLVIHRIWWSTGSGDPGSPDLVILGVPKMTPFWAHFGSRFGPLLDGGLAESEPYSAWRYPECAQKGVKKWSGIGQKVGHFGVPPKS